MAKCHPNKEVSDAIEFAVGSRLGRDSWYGTHVRNAALSKRRS